jgi:hypothetical protein
MQKHLAELEKELDSMKLALSALETKLVPVTKSIPLSGKNLVATQLQADVSPISTTIIRLIENCASLRLSVLELHDRIDLEA